MIVREAGLQDAPALATLIGELGFETNAFDVAERLPILCDAGLPPLVVGDDTLWGCLTWHVMEVIHRPHPVGRISMLIVSERARDRGIGRALVEAAEARMALRGCGLAEVTSNLKLEPAHGFYAHLGYDRTSYRFGRRL